jgi:hypothetical protein
MGNSGPKLAYQEGWAAITLARRSQQRADSRAFVSILNIQEQGLCLVLPNI